MKKSILALGIILAAGFNVYAQDVSKPARTTTVSIGPTLSFGHASTSNLGRNVWKPAGGLGVGMMIDKGMWGVGMNLMASHEGYKRPFTNANGAFRETIDPTYLRFTPAFYFFPGHFSTSVRPMIYAGPSVARKIAEDHYMSNTITHEQDNQHFVTNNMYKEWDFGVMGGAGINAQVTPNTSLQVSGSYYHGFFDVINGNENSNVMLNVGWMIGL